MVKVTIKWNKQTFPDVELNQSDSAVAFKSLVFSLTGVPVDRQKLMAKGVWKLTLKDDEDLSKLSVKDGTTIMLVGTAEVVKEPVEKAVFLEDLTAAEAAKAGALLPAGLVNLGNTCYMNSTLQCLRHVPELRDALGTFRGGGGGGGGGDQQAQLFTAALRDTYNLLDRSPEAVPPFQFVTVLRQLYPQFAQQGRGGYMQQDADELFGAVLATLAQNLRDTSRLPSTPTSSSRVDNFIDALMGMEVEETYTCEETDMESSVVSKDTVRKLTCNISGGGGSDVKINYLQEGIRLALEGQVEKNSEVLGRNALWKKRTRISRLPRYLCVQFMRFFWKATPDSQDHAGVKSKIMRSVVFPEHFDIYEFCSESVQAKLKVNRDKEVDAILSKPPGSAEVKADGTSETAAGGGGSSSSTTTDVTMANADDEEAAALQAALAMSLAPADAPPPPPQTPAGPGLPLDFKGNYELFGVVTHKGRSADGGHYMGWVRQKGDDWLVFDDADVSECKTEDILKLSGGGDWHMAYLCFYRFKS